MIDAAPLVMILLASLRWLIVLFAVPVIGAAVPPQARLILAIAMGLLVAPAAPPVALSGAVVSIVVTEIAVGALFALIIAAAFAVPLMAGDFLASMSGLSFASFIAPDSGGMMNALARLFLLLALAAFLSMDGYARLFAIVAQSYQRFPLGLGGIGPEIGPVLANMTVLFSQCLGLALPFAALLLAGNFVLGLIARTAPQINLIVVGLPGGLLLLLLLLVASFGHLLAAFAGVIAYWLDLAAGL